jgi:hypothetical protein
MILLVLFLAITFWAKFAYVYDIPNFANASIGHVNAYVTVKPWWFGPTVFDLDTYESYPVPDFASANPYAVLVENLGQYQTIVQSPNFIWIQRGSG